MKIATFFLILVLLAIPFQSASAKPIYKNMITITAGEVDSADDIEAAIIDITSGGTLPGTVVLDGKNGPFIFTGADRSLNIFVSNLTLKGVNEAIVENCDDGLFFDDFPLKQILVDGITFLCTGDGVEATGAFQDVTLSNNVFWAQNNGIGTNGHSRGWLITNNYIQADGDAISLTGAESVIITNNYLSGNNGVVLWRDTQFRVHRNAIHASYGGILLGQEAWENMVQGNIIHGISYAGIALEPGVIDNRILANWVRCAPGATCLTVEALPNVLESNKIAGNKP